MRIYERTTITFNEESIKQLVKEKVESEGYKAVEIKVNIKKNQWTEGHGFSEMDYERLILENVEVIAEKKKL